MKNSEPVLRVRVAREGAFLEPEERRVAVFEGPPPCIETKEEKGRVPVVVARGALEHVAGHLEFFFPSRRGEQLFPRLSLRRDDAVGGRETPPVEGLLFVRKDGFVEPRRIEHRFDASEIGGALDKPQGLFFIGRLALAPKRHEPGEVQGFGHFLLDG